jgi:hypothetical protein
VSLTPGERRALTRIEIALSRSDPALARMLATFSVPARPGRAWRRECLAGRISRARRSIMVMIVVVAMGVMLISGLLGGSGGNRLCLRDGARVIAGGQALTCPPAVGAPPHRARPSGPGSTGIRSAGGGAPARR